MLEINLWFFLSLISWEVENGLLLVRCGTGTDGTTSDFLGKFSFLIGIVASWARTLCVLACMIYAVTRIIWSPAMDHKANNSRLSEDVVVNPLRSARASE